MAGETTTDPLMRTKLHRSPVSPHMSVNNSSNQIAKTPYFFTPLYPIWGLVQGLNGIRISNTYEI